MAYIDIKGFKKYKRGSLEWNYTYYDPLRQENQWNDSRKRNSTDSDLHTDPGLYTGF